MQPQVINLHERRNQFAKALHQAVTLCGAQYFALKKPLEQVKDNADIEIREETIKRALPLLARDERNFLVYVSQFFTHSITEFSEHQLCIPAPDISEINTMAEPYRSTVLELAINFDGFQPIEG